MTAFSWAKEFGLIPIGSTLRKNSLVEMDMMAWSSARLEAEGQIKRML